MGEREGPANTLDSFTYSDQAFESYDECMDDDLKNCNEFDEEENSDEEEEGGDYCQRIA